MAEVIDLGEYGDGFRRDPHAVYARLREHGPVHLVRPPVSAGRRPAAAHAPARPGPAPSPCAAWRNCGRAVVSCAADHALTFAGGAALGPAVLTGGFSIQYLRPAIGRRLRAHAEVGHAGRRQAVVRCELHAVAEDGAERLCAVAQGTVPAVPTP